MYLMPILAVDNIKKWPLCVHYCVSSKATKTAVVAVIRKEMSILLHNEDQNCPAPPNLYKHIISSTSSPTQAQTSFFGVRICKKQTKENKLVLTNTAVSTWMNTGIVERYDPQCNLHIGHNYKDNINKVFIALIPFLSFRLLIVY